MLNYNELAGIKRRDFYRGRAIYREFVRKYDHDDFANDEEYYLRLKRSKPIHVNPLSGNANKLDFEDEGGAAGDAGL